MTVCRATIIENVFEELDAPSEFYFNRTTRTLWFWYNATTPTPPPLDGSVVAPVLHTVLTARGTQAEPVRGVTLRGLGSVATHSPCVLMRGARADRDNGSPPTPPRLARSACSRAHET